MEYKDRNKIYNETIKVLNSELEGLIDRLQDDIDKNNKIIDPITSDLPPSCGSIKRNPYAEGAKLTPEELKEARDAKDTISDITAEMLANEMDFPDANQVVPPKPAPPGKGKGGDKGMFKVPGLGGTPKWFKEIEAGVGELIGIPEKGRKGIDYEGAQTYISQGIFINRKPKAKISAPNKQIYILLDQSGSMRQMATGGISFLKLLASFIPELAKKYEGYFWVCDDCNMNIYDADEALIPNDSVQLKNVTQRIVYHGGGGTAFSGAFKKLGDIERTKQKKNPKYEMCLIFFSDMEVGSEFQDYRKYGPTRQIYVTAESRRDLLNKQEFIQTDPNIKAVYIDMVKTKKKNNE